MSDNNNWNSSDIQIKIQGFTTSHTGSGTELPGGKLFPILFFSMIIFLLIIFFEY